MIILFLILLIGSCYLSFEQKLIVSGKFDNELFISTFNVNYVCLFMFVSMCVCRIVVCIPSQSKGHDESNTHCF